MNKRRIKDIAKISTGQTPPRELLDCFSDNSCDASNTMWIKPEDMHTSKEINITREYLTPKGLNYVKNYPKESVIFNGIGAGVGNVALSNKRFTTNQQNHVLYKCKHYKYLYYYLLCHKETIAQLSSGNVVPILNGSKLKNFIVLDANNFYLDKIVLFLDKNCSKIDSEISLLEKKSELLEEYKQSLIFETVTKGLDKNAKMKDSGVDWIGEIPKDKSLIRIKDILKQGIKSNIPASEKEEDGNYDFYLSGSKVKKSNHYITDKEVLLLPDGGAFYVHYNKEKNKCAYSNHVIPYINKNNFNLKYIYYFLISNKEVLNEILFNGIGLKNLDRKSFLDTFIIAFNKKEQENIVVFLDIETKKIEKQIELINKKIELLKEYKQSLIYEAVTGQLDIE
jgi:type I restriction enzyme S subunit